MTPTRKDTTMDLLLVAIFLVSLAVLGVLAITLGTDSRDSFRDDWSGGAQI
jgi:hypothetical protein